MAYIHQQAHTWAPRTAPSGWVGSWPPSAPVSYPGPPPPPAGINPASWSTGQWQFNPMFRGPPPGAQSVPAWAPHPSWGQSATQQPSYNPYKRVPVNNMASDYWKTALLDNPLGLENMHIRDDSNVKTRDSVDGAPHTPWVWVPRELRRSPEQGQAELHDPQDAQRTSGKRHRSHSHSQTQPPASAQSQTPPKQHPRDRETLMSYKVYQPPNQSSNDVAGQQSQGGAQLQRQGSKSRQPSGGGVVPPALPTTVSTYSAYSQQQQQQRTIPQQSTQPQPQPQRQTSKDSSPRYPQEPQPQFSKDISPRHDTNTMHQSNRDISPRQSQSLQRSDSRDISPRQQSGSQPQRSPNPAQRSPNNEPSLTTNSAQRSPNRPAQNGSTSASASAPVTTLRPPAPSEEAFSSRQVLHTTFSPKIVRTPDHYSSTPSRRHTSMDDNREHTPSRPPISPNSHGPIYAPASTTSTPTRRASASDAATGPVSPLSHLPNFVSQEPDSLLSPLLSLALPPPAITAEPDDVSQPHSRALARSQTYPFVATAPTFDAIPEDRATPRTPRPRDPHRQSTPHATHPRTPTQPTPDTSRRIGRSQTFPNIGASPQSVSHTPRSPKRTAVSRANPLPPPPKPIAYSSASAYSASQSQTQAQQPSAPPALRRVRRGFWNRRGDHIVLEREARFIVYAPHHRANPTELAHYPSPTEGFMDEHQQTVKYDPNVPEMPESLPLHGEPPTRPYEEFVQYTYV